MTPLQSVQHWAPSQTTFISTLSLQTVIWGRQKCSFKELWDESFTCLPEALEQYFKSPDIIQNNMKLSTNSPILLQCWSQRDSPTPIPRSDLSPHKCRISLMIVLQGDCRAWLPFIMATRFQTKESCTETVLYRSETGMIYEWLTWHVCSCFIKETQKGFRSMTLKERSPFRALLIHVTLKNGDKWGAIGRQWLLRRQKSVWERYLGFIGKLWLRKWKSQIIYRSSMGVRSRIWAKLARCETKWRVCPSSDLYLG